ncbi:MAG: hypothetical protein LBL62_10195 [Planctomycetaceae bacterium]|nr:hypothetical protein [Planctomycetaceae bacterium]
MNTLSVFVLVTSIADMYRAFLTVALPPWRCLFPLIFPLFRTNNSPSFFDLESQLDKIHEPNNFLVRLQKIEKKDV